MALFDFLKNFTSKVTQPIVSTLGKIEEAPVDQGGILGTLGRVADITARTAQQVPISNLTANILSGRREGTLVSKSLLSPQLNYTPVPVTPQSPLYSPVGGTGSLYTDPISGATFRFDESGRWLQISSGVRQTVPTAPQPPPALTPVSIRRSRFNIPTGPGAGQTLVSGTEQLLTGLGGFGGISAGQFGGGTGISGIEGGGAKLPGSLSTGFRTIPLSGFNIPTQEELEERRKNVVGRATQSLGLGDLLRGLLGVPTAVAATSAPTPTPAQTPSGTPTSPVISPLARGQVPLTVQQNELLSSTFGPYFDKGFISAPNSPITGQEFASATTDNVPPPSIKPTDTVSAMKNNLQNRITQTFSNNNSRDAIITQQATEQAQKLAIQKTLAASGGYVKVSDPTSGQINVAKLNSDGSTSYVSLAEFQQKGLNIDHIPDAEQVQNGATTILNGILSQVIDTVTGKPYIKEDFDLPPENKSRAEIDKIDKEIQDNVTKYHLTDSPDLETIRTAVSKEEGLASSQAQARQLKENINGIIGEFEKVSDEIRDDPDFSAKLKSKRLSFMDNEKQRALAGFQRQLDLVNDDIKIKSDKVSQIIKDKLDTYNLRVKVVQDLEKDRTRLETQLNKEADDARALFTFYINTFGGTAWADLSKETRKAITSEFNRLNASHLVNLLKSGLQTQKDKSLELSRINTQLRAPTNQTFIFGGQEFQGLKTPSGSSVLGGFTNDQIERGAANAGLAITDFQKFGPEAANLFINNYANVTATKTDLESRLKSGISASRLEGMIAGLQLPPEAKDYLTKYLKSIASTFSGSRRKLPGEQ